MSTTPTTGVSCVTSVQYRVCGALLVSRSLLVKDPFERIFVEMEHQELKKERHQLKQLSKTDTVRTARQEDKRTEEIANIAYIILLDELWCFTFRRARPVDGIGEELRYLIYFFQFQPSRTSFQINFSFLFKVICIIFLKNKSP